MENNTYPLHGRISNQPAEHCYWTEDEEQYCIHGTIKETGIFLEKLQLNRRIFISKKDNTIKIKDMIQNLSEDETPCMVIYHMNMQRSI